LKSDAEDRHKKVQQQLHIQRFLVDKFCVHIIETIPMTCSKGNKTFMEAFFFSFLFGVEEISCSCNISVYDTKLPEGQGIPRKIYLLLGDKS
jgi:hypothetical protein